MNPTTQAEALSLAPGSALRDAAKRLSVEKLNCKTCVHGSEDTDGEPGNTWYCGMVCTLHDLPSTYLEDNDVDPETEKACWEPDFWKCATPGIMDIVDASDASLDAACVAWRKLLDEIMPKDSPNVKALPRPCGERTDK